MPFTNSAQAIYGFVPISNAGTATGLSPSSTKDEVHANVLVLQHYQKERIINSSSINQYMVTALEQTTPCTSAACKNGYLCLPSERGATLSLLANALLDPIHANTAILPHGQNRQVNSQAHVTRSHLAAPMAKIRRQLIRHAAGRAHIRCKGVPD